MKFSAPNGMAGVGKLFFAGDKVRMEMSAMGHQSVIITDMPHKLAYVVMPEQHMYMQMSMEAQGAHKGPDWHMYNAANPCANIPNTTCQKIGTETVNGRMCTKWKFAGHDAGTNRTVWIDQTGMPIKTVADDGTAVEITDIKPGPQSPSLFEVPAGYQKLDMGNMMKGSSQMPKE